MNHALVLLALASLAMVSPLSPVDPELEDSGLSDKQVAAKTQPPQLEYQAAIQYPESWRQSGFSGTVTLRALVRPDGTVEKAEVSRTSGNNQLDKAAAAAALANRYSPARDEQGRPVACWIAYPVLLQIDSQSDSVSEAKPPPDK